MSGALQSNLVLGRRAFSLVELLVTIAIIVILCALLFPALTRARERAKKVKCGVVLHQVYLTTTLYADAHQGQMPSWDIFFKTNTVPPLCPSATERLTAVTYGGYSWSPFPFDPLRRIDQLDRSWWMVNDKIPWHDPKRTRTADRFWEGRVNQLLADGHVEWIHLTTPP